MIPLIPRDSSVVVFANFGGMRGISLETQCFHSTSALESVVSDEQRLLGNCTTFCRWKRNRVATMFAHSCFSVKSWFLPVPADYKWCLFN